MLAKRDQPTTEKLRRHLQTSRGPDRRTPPEENQGQEGTKNNSSSTSSSSSNSDSMPREQKLPLHPQATSTSPAPTPASSTTDPGERQSTSSLVPRILRRKRWPSTPYWGGPSRRTVVRGGILPVAHTSVGMSPRSLLLPTSGRRRRRCAIAGSCHGIRHAGGRPPLRLYGSSGRRA